MSARRLAHDLLYNGPYVLGGNGGASLVQAPAPSDAGTTGLNFATLGGGTTAAPQVVPGVATNGLDFRFSFTATSGTNRAAYFQAAGDGAGAEVTALRARAIPNVALANSYGAEIGIEPKITTGYVTGLMAGVRAGLILPGAAMHAAGTYYGAQSFINLAASGSVAAVTACAIHAFTVEGDAAAGATVLNLFSISGVGADSGGAQMVSPGTSMGTVTGTIRILLNGAIAYLPYYSHTGHA